MKNETAMHKPKFYVGHKDTRWHVYPQPQPAEVVAHDHRGHWAYDAQQGWFKSPLTYNWDREITREEAASMVDSTT